MTFFEELRKLGKLRKLKDNSLVPDFEVREVKGIRS